jgi:hypothetical protein
MGLNVGVLLVVSWHEKGVEFSVRVQIRGERREVQRGTRMSFPCSTPVGTEDAF